MDKTKPLKVLHVVGAMNRAGTETMLMNIYRNIDRNKIQFDFISYSQKEAHYDQEIERLGGRIIRLAKTYSVKEIYAAIKKYGPYDVVHAHTLFNCGIANLAARLAGIKIRISHAHTTLDTNQSLIRTIYKRIMRKLINITSTKLLACSNGAGRYLFGEKELGKIRYSYYPNVIDYTKFLEPPLKEVKKFKEEADLENRFVIGHIGRFMDAKNHLFLIEIMKNILKKQKNITLLLVGDGELRASIEEEVKKFGIEENIKFVGVREDIPTLLHSMDLFVFPSLYEGLGLVLLEAQASGISCIVSEAIQPEADLNISLVKQLLLCEGPETWANTILMNSWNKEGNINRIINGFETEGYSVSNGISNLLAIYQYSTGELNEEKYISGIL
ncbi:glycosyltransferase family 1 protein [Gottfriedia acidiceleris]|uniref:Glycosyltransferase family 1 protein n=1 Tax=Gottfriedia acidiceleris TaxID=371036 RepID=A0ABY4JJZ3_9BACI|nr:glycosyltransferase family 1 protein [Gottfriedia acidiceleris]UPM54166.1 glycosyltransferase family 1 protein [Gottfriedia acidiceleris]